MITASLPLVKSVESLRDPLLPEHYYVINVFYMHSYEDQVAGVSVPELVDAPPYHQSVHDMTHYYELAMSDAADGKRPNQGYDPRLSTLYLPEQFGANPTYTFVVDRNLLQHVSRHLSNKDAPSQAQLIHLALEAGDTSVHPDFRADALNAINASYYASKVAFDPEAGLATMYAKNRFLNKALGTLLARSAVDQKLRIKEISSGSNTAHWNFISEALQEAGVEKVDITLTDFVRPADNPALQLELADYHQEVYSLFDPLPSLDEPSRYDAIVTTYGFDSVWLPEDISLIKTGGKWYQQLYRVKVADWHPRQAELVTAMRNGEPLLQANLHDYDGIFIEEAMQPYDLASHPYEEYITASKKRSLNFPGGLIARISEAFRSQLSPDGVFVSADVGDFGRKAKAWFPAHLTSGMVARYRPDDYVIAKTILEEEFGLSARLYGLDKLTDETLGPAWTEKANPLEQEQINNNPSNGVLVVRNAN